MSEKTRREHVTIEKIKQGDVNIGKSAVTRTTHVCFSFKEIEDICKFDLENIFSSQMVKFSNK